MCSTSAEVHTPHPSRRTELEREQEQRASKQTWLKLQNIIEHALTAHNIYTPGQKKGKILSSTTNNWSENKQELNTK